MNNIDDNLISLDESTHIYSLKDSQDIKFTSVTTYIGEFFEKFDQQKIAKKLVDTNIKYAHRTIEDIISDWDKSRDYGTLVHKQIEDHLNGKYEADDVKAKHAIKWLNEFLQTNHREFLKDEWKSKKYLYCGITVGWIRWR